jgi:tetratricopeptide (TPR) repeat protein
MTTEGHRRGWQIAVVVLLALLPYLNALQAGFTLDDGPVIRGNVSVTDGIDIGRIFAAPLFGRLYRPFTVLTYAADEAVAPLQPWIFHGTNVFLHVVVSVLVFILAEQLFRSAAVALPAAALFAVHPIHTEAVTSIVGRAELLAALFGLLAIVAAVAAESHTRRPLQVALRVGSVMSFLLAVLSKESAATLLPLVFYARIVTRGDEFWRGVWKELRAGDWVAYALCVSLAFALRLHVLGGLIQESTDGVSSLVPLSRLDNVLGFAAPLDRLRSAVAILWDYFGLLNVPLVLAADYSYNQVPLVVSWWDPRWLAGVALLLAAFLTLLLHRQPAVRFAVALPLLTLSATANVFFAIGTIKAERLLYLPSVGWALLIGAAVAALLQQPRYRRVVALAFVLLVVAFAGRTWERNWDWANDWTLYRSMVESAPNSAKARNNYGVALQQDGQDAAAVEQFEAALAIYPEAEAAALGVGIARQRAGRVDEALVWFERAIAIRPGYLLAHGYRCAAYLQGGDYAAAGAACRAGLRHQPANADLLKGLGYSFAGLHDEQRAGAVLQRALALNPGDEEIRTYLARAVAPPAGDQAAEPNG